MWFESPFKLLGQKGELVISSQGRAVTEKPWKANSREALEIEFDDKVAQQFLTTTHKTRRPNFSFTIFRRPYN